MKDNHSSITSLLMLGVLMATLLYSLVFCMAVYTEVGATFNTPPDQALSQQEYGRLFLERASLFGIPFLALLMLVIALSIKLIMSPITKTLKQVQEISFTNSNVRLEKSTLPEELKPLANAVNGALDRLEKGITAQKDFIAHAAHELRTPLAVLRTHVDLLEDKSAAAKMRQDVDSMARMVSQLLDTARLESPEILDMSRIDLSEVVKTVSQGIWPLMLRQNRIFEVEGIDQPYYMNGNFDVLCRALRNLLENALNHTPEGTAIALTLDPPFILVRDHGKGVPDAEKQKIFGKFSRRDGQQSGGAGLGLFIVKRIMQMHNGMIAVEDAPGGGALFVMQFKGMAPQAKDNKKRQEQ